MEGISLLMSHLVNSGSSLSQKNVCISPYESPSVSFSSKGHVDDCFECRLTILVQYCRTDTTREWLDTTCTTRTTRTGRETMVYGLYRSWINGDMHIISNTALQPRRYDPYESYDS